MGLSPSSARVLRSSAEASGRSVFGLIRSGDTPVGVSENEMDRARRTIAAVDEAASNEKFLQKVDALWKGLPAIRELFERHTEDAEAARAITDATVFLRSARAYARVSRSPSVEGFLATSRMVHEDSDTWAPSTPSEEGAVRLMTVHGSKGLEFDAVFVSGLTEDRFPVRGRGVQLVDPGLLATWKPTPKPMAPNKINRMSLMFLIIFPFAPAAVLCPLSPGDRNLTMADARYLLSPCSRQNADTSQLCHR